jgi:hypothetical protein
MSQETYRKAKAVIEAAEQHPRKFGHVAAEMEKSGKVTPAYEKLRQQQGEPPKLKPVNMVGTLTAEKVEGELTPPKPNWWPQEAATPYECVQFLCKHRLSVTDLMRAYKWLGKLIEKSSG